MRFKFRFCLELTLCIKLLNTETGKVTITKLYFTGFYTNTHNGFPLVGNNAILVQGAIINKHKFQSQTSYTKNTILLLY